VKATTYHEIELGGRRVDYRVVQSSAARMLRVRVGPNGIEVVQPAERTLEDVAAFLDSQQSWVLDQLQRVEQLRRVWQSEHRRLGEILFRGEPTRVRVVPASTRARRNRVDLIDGEIVVLRAKSSMPVARSLENWLRRRARTEIEKHLAAVCAQLGQDPGRIYVMAQRTKWGNCSSSRNLSFNWRLVMAPDFVLRYIVVHETVHLAVPDHSASFWLTVQSICPETERARQWLSRNGPHLLEPLPLFLELP
jgi:predicted metal-dependent hydrolase